MRHCHFKRNQNFCPTASLAKLWTLVSEQTRVNAAQKETAAAPTWMCGSGKVLGKEKLPKQPVTGKANSSAQELRLRVLGGGGACVLVA
uniref:Large ribosomal subunit protein uL15 n=1 Tax=Prolemur simus TaxID=1328070 RepID=A0A8C9ANQ1_PROSS